MLYALTNFTKDWVSAIVKDDWTKCVKIIKHLKNQKKIFVSRYYWLEETWKYMDYSKKNIFLIIFATQIGSKLSKNHENRPKLALPFFHAFLISLISVIRKL